MTDRALNLANVVGNRLVGDIIIARHQSLLPSVNILTPPIQDDAFEIGFDATGGNLVVSNGSAWVTVRGGDNPVNDLRLEGNTTNTASATGVKALAAGHFTSASGNGAVAVGGSNTTGEGASASGPGSLALGGASTAGKRAARATAAGATAVGPGTDLVPGAEATADYASAFGAGSLASAANAFAFGTSDVTGVYTNSEVNSMKFGNRAGGVQTNFLELRGIGPTARAISAIGGGVTWVFPGVFAPAGNAQMAPGDVFPGKLIIPSANATITTPDFGAPLSTALAALNIPFGNMFYMHVIAGAGITVTMAVGAGWGAIVGNAVVDPTTSGTFMINNDSATPTLTRVA